MWGGYLAPSTTPPRRWGPTSPAPFLPGAPVPQAFPPCSAGREVVSPLGCFCGGACRPHPPRGGYRPHTPTVRKGFGGWPSLFRFGARPIRRTAYTSRRRLTPRIPCSLLSSQHSPYGALLLRLRGRVPPAPPSRGLPPPHPHPSTVVDAADATLRSRARPFGRNPYASLRACRIHHCSLSSGQHSPYAGHSAPLRETPCRAIPFASLRSPALGAVLLRLRGRVPPAPPSI